MNSELEEVKALVDEMAVLWVTQEVIDLEGKDHSEAFEFIRTHPRFFAMIMTAWMSGRWYEQAVQRRSRFDPDPELLKDLEKEFPRPVSQGKVYRPVDIELAKDLAHEFGWQSRAS